MIKPKFSLVIAVFLLLPVNIFKTAYASEINNLHLSISKGLLNITKSDSLCPDAMDNQINWCKAIMLSQLDRCDELFLSSERPTLIQCQQRVKDLKQNESNSIISQFLIYALTSMPNTDQEHPENTKIGETIRNALGLNQHYYKILQNYYHSLRSSRPSLVQLPSEINQYFKIAESTKCSYCKKNKCHGCLIYYPKDSYQNLVMATRALIKKNFDESAGDLLMAYKSIATEQTKYTQDQFRDQYLNFLRLHYLRSHINKTQRSYLKWRSKISEQVHRPLSQILLKKSRANLIECRYINGIMDEIKKRDQFIVEQAQIMYQDILQDEYDLGCDIERNRSCWRQFENGK